MTDLYSHRTETAAGAPAEQALIRLLNQIARAIRQQRAFRDVLDEVLVQLGEFFAVDAALFFVADPAVERLTLTTLHSRWADRLTPSQFATLLLDESGLQRCRNGEQICWADLASQTERPGQMLFQAQLSSAAATPLMVEGRLFGVLLIARGTQRPFTGDELELLQSLSEHLSLAVQHLELRARLKQSSNELRNTHAVVQQERLKALSQMASGIAHDLNNALSPVIGFADLIARSEKGLTDNGRRYLQLIRTAGEDVANIIARLRHFYRRRGPREGLGSIDLNRVAQQVIEMTRPRWVDIPQGLGLLVEVETDLQAAPPLIMGSEGEVREALTNLIFNASDALPRGGKITVRTRSSDADNGLGPEAIVEVSDNGVGMDEVTRKRCLEPFFSTKGKRGTGLGLAMVYGIMERHDGRIEVEAEPGKGSTFRLIFPARNGQTEKPAAAGVIASPVPFAALHR